MANNNDIIRFDWAIKRILRDKANFGVLEGLMTVLLGDILQSAKLFPAFLPMAEPLFPPSSSSGTHGPSF